MSLIKLKSATKDYIWGGTKLKEIYKDVKSDKIAESWVLSFHDDGPSIIDSSKNHGKLLKDVLSKAEIGTKINEFPFFPVLIKIIDSKGDLSVQVHPSDEYALKNENSFGKTEVWHILSHEKDAKLYLGLNDNYSKDEIEKAINEGTILKYMNAYNVTDGETYFVKSGTLHAIGKGITLIEIQENSNLTYRVYDYDRVDKNGNKRELHIEKALKVIDLNKYEIEDKNPKILAKTKYFTSILTEIDGEKTIKSDEKSFINIVVVKGDGKVGEYDAKLYDSFFLCANSEVTIKGKLHLILTKM